MFNAMRTLLMLSGSLLLGGCALAQLPAAVGLFHQSSTPSALQTAEEAQAVIADAITESNPAARGLSQPSEEERAARLTRLFAELRQAETAQAARFIADEIEAVWSDVDEPTAELFTDRARMAMLAEDYFTARKLIDAALVRAPHSNVAWRLSARIARHEGFIERALTDVERALALNPDDFESMIVLGALLESVRRPGAANEAYRTAHQMNPWSPEASGGMKRLAPHVGGRES
jgi:tetratricopeptide (TPR) repeat protein